MAFYNEEADILLLRLIELVRQFPASLKQPGYNPIPVTNKVLNWLRFFSEKSIDDQQENGAHGGDENPAKVERLDLPETDEAAQKTTDDRTGDPD